MKKFTVLILFATTLAVAQVPNGSFEVWSNDAPSGWATPNAPNLPLLVTQSANAKTGSFAAKGEVAQWSPDVVVSPFIQSGDDASGFPYTQRPVKFTGSYTFAPAGNDRFSISVVLMKGDDLVGLAARTFSGATSEYRDFEIPFEYLNNDTPDRCIATVMIIGPELGSDYHLGSSFLVDDLNFSDSPVAVEEEAVNPVQFNLQQNYPNPFNPSTVISYELPVAGNVTLTVYNSLGETVKTLVNGQMESGIHQVTFNASDLPSGLYLYELKTGSHTSVKKMLLMK